MGGLPPTIAVISQPTRLQGLISRWATRSAAKFRLKQAFLHERARRSGSVTRRNGQRAENTASLANDLEASEDVLMEYEQEDSAQQKTLDRLKIELDLGYPVKFVEREYLPTFDFRGCVAVVVVGRDGLVANAAKYVGDLPVVAVNPDPQRIDGILLPFQVQQARHAVHRTIQDKAKIREVTLAEVNLNDGQRMLAFNDFFIGYQSHVSARYVLRLDDRSEPQSSSGLIVSTGAGSTGWLSSLFNMAEGFARWAGGQVADHVQMAWEDRRLVWAVREPFRSRQSGADLVAGFLEQGRELIIESLMPSGGVIFSDGVDADFLEFTSGTIARIGVASQRARLVVG
jgi:NAD kinase